MTEITTTWDKLKARRPSDAHRAGYASDLIARAQARQETTASSGGAPQELTPSTTTGE